MMLSAISLNSSTSEKIHPFIPTTLTFLSPGSGSSFSLQRSLVYVRQSPGRYKLVVELSGPSSLSCQVEYPRGQVFEVLGPDQEPSPPVLVSAEFSSDGSSVLVLFDSPTDRGGYWNVFDCRGVLRTVSVTSSSRCVWLDDSSFVMYPSTSRVVSSSTTASLLSIGDTLMLKGSVMRAKCRSELSTATPCSGWKFSFAQNVTVTAPSEPAMPVVNLISSASIGPCDSLPVDVSSSRGSGGRPFKTVSFGINSTNHSSTVSIASVASILRFLDSNSSLTARFSVPRSLFVQGETYTMTVRLCNFVGGCGESRHSFDVLDSESVPMVSINSVKEREMKRKSQLLVSGQAYTSICGGGQSVSNLQFSWKMKMISSLPSPTTNSSSASLGDFRSTSNDPCSFRLAPYSLEVGSSYSLTLTVRHTISSQSSSSSILICVLRGDVVAVISGSSEKVLTVDGQLLLDGSGSYDEDSSSGVHLMYSYSCVRILPSYSEDCVLDFDLGSDAVSSSNLSSVSRAIVSVKDPFKLNNQTLNTVHEVTMTVRSSQDTNTNSILTRRVSSVSVRVRVLPSESPVVSVLSLVGTRINPSQKLKLLGEIMSPSRSGGVASWSVDDGSILLVAGSLSEISKTWSSSVSASSLSNVKTVMSLVLSPDSLPQQSRLVFTLSCELSSGLSSSSSIVITTNSPPLPGVYSASPSRGGRMMETEYEFVSSGWEDVDLDLPLTYEFSFQSFSGTYLVHRSRLELSYSSSKLPRGLSREHEGVSELSTRVRVFDSVDGRSEAYASVEVLALKLSSTEVRALLLASLSASEGNVDEMMKSIGLGSAVLNSVNCSGSLDCAVELNRMPCSSTVGTCGECLSGYLGERGHANSRCVSRSVLQSESTSRVRRRRQLSSGGNLERRNSQSRCTTDSDCDVDQWEVCSKESGECVSRPKSCPNNCSGVGACVFVSSHDSTVRVSECSVLDVDCESRCDCGSGFKGLSCEHSEEAFESALDSRHLLVEGLDRLSALQDVSASSVLSWIAGLSSMSGDSRLLRDDTKVKMAELCLRYLSFGGDLGLSAEDLESVGSILDLTLDVSGKDLSSSLPVISLLNSYNDFIQSDLVSGQRPVSVLNRLFRATHYSVGDDTANSDSNLTLSPPRSPFEEYLADPSQQVILTSSALLGVNKVSIVESHFSVAETRLITNQTSDGTHLKPPQQQQLLSVPIALNFDSPPCNSTFSNTSCVTQITLLKSFVAPTFVNLTAVSGATSIPEVDILEVECMSGDHSTHNVSCLNGEVMGLTCEGSPGLLRRRCPVLNSSSICVSLLEGRDCDVISNVNESVICECSLATTLVAHDHATRLNFGVLSRSSLHEFVATWSSANDLTVREVSETLTVLFTVGLVGLIGVLFVLASMKLDSRDRTLAIADKAMRVGQVKAKKSLKRRIGRVIAGSAEAKRIEDCLPLVMRPVPLMDKCKNELRMHHRWVGILFHYSESYPRSLRAASLVIGILTMLFVQSVTYDLADPDDGSCEKQSTVEGCLREKSMLSNTDKCEWDSESASCLFRPIDNDFERVLVVALISGILSAPLSILFQSLILFVLAAKTRSQSSVLSGHDHQRNIRVPSARSSLFPPAGTIEGEECLETSLPEDLKNLLAGVRLHREHLSEGKLLEFDSKLPLLSLPHLT
jgi:hypothetical protein